MSHSPPDLTSLTSAFPVAYPAGLILTDSYGDAKTETAPFDNLLWPDVPPALLQANFEAPFFFSPSAFIYFLPSVIWHSTKDLRPIELFLRNSLTVLSDPGLLPWRQDRFKLLDQPKLQILHQWLNWLKATGLHKDLASFPDAAAAVELAIRANHS